MAYVSVLFGSDTIDERTLDRDRVTVGRSAQCDLVIDNLGISRTHFIIVRDGDAWLLEDTGTTNGTFINGVKVFVRQPLNDGDVVTLGKHRVVYHASGTAAKTNQVRKLAMGGEMTFMVDAAAVQRHMATGQTSKTERTARPGEPGPPTANMALAVMRGMHVTRIPLSQNEHRMGSTDAADIPSPGFLVKGIQAVLTRLPNGGHCIESRGGLRRVCVNGKPISTAQKLNRNDVIRIASREYTYVEVV